MLQSILLALAQWEFSNMRTHIKIYFLDNSKDLKKNQVNLSSPYIPYSICIQHAELPANFKNFPLTFHSVANSQRNQPILPLLVQDAFYN